MTAVLFEPDPSIPVPKELLAPGWLAVAVAALTVLILGLALSGSIFDERLADRSAREAARLRATVADLEAVKAPYLLPQMLRDLTTLHTYLVRVLAALAQYTADLEVLMAALPAE